MIIMNFKTTYVLFGILAIVLLVFVWTLWLGPTDTEKTAYVLPSMHKEGSLAPTQDGLALAKDSWLVGIGLSLLLRGLGERRPRVSVKKAEKTAKKAAKEAAKRARKAGRQVRKAL